MKASNDSESNSIPEVPDELAHVATHLEEFHPNSPRSAVYFLISQGVIVYVGQTRSLAARIEAHRIDKQFDRVLFMPVPRRQLDWVEASYIDRIRPKYNRLVPRVPGVAPMGPAPRVMALPAPCEDE